MARFFSFLALGVGGLMLADILIHPAGVTAASTGAVNLEQPAINGLLGTVS